MKRLFLAIPLVLLVCAPALWALEIVPVWEHTLIDQDKVLPILTNYVDWRWADGDDPPYYGVSKFDQYDGFARYDADRLLLGIKDNGIDETEADHDADLAARFPDRSLIWINPGDGAPMGVAIHFGFNIVPLSAEYEDMIDGGAGDPPIPGFTEFRNMRPYYGTQDAPEYMAWDCADDGTVYLGYHYMILRWDPDGNGGFTGPTVAYEIDYRNHGGTDRLSQWRFGDINAEGSGANTHITTSGKTWRNGMGIRIFNVDATTNTWTQVGEHANTRNACLPSSGGVSQVVTDSDGESFIYHAGNVASPGGVIRYYWDGNVDFLRDDAAIFSISGPADADGYNAPIPNFSTSDVAAHNDLDYIVVAVTPVWAGINNSAVVDRPGWIVAYSLINPDPIGEYLGSFKFGGTKPKAPVESDERYKNDGNALWNGIMGHMVVNRLPGYADGACEVLYLSQLYGYGRYTIGDTGVSDWSIY